MTDGWKQENEKVPGGAGPATGERPPAERPPAEGPPAEGPPAEGPSAERRRPAEPRVYGGGSQPEMPVPALLAGLVAALVGGAIWAAVAIYGNLEVGWVAWGIGALVGGAMSRATPRRSQGIALAAAVLALVGLTAGKAMTFAGSVGPVAQEMAEDDSYMRGMTAWTMYEDGTLDAELIQAVDDTQARGDTLSDALWADMLGAADIRLAAMTADQKVDLARVTATGMMREMGVVNGIVAQLSLFDLLWVGLALATAYGMMARQEQATA